jgi:hypothetical protein
MDFNPTTVTHIAPNDSARQATEKLATIQADRVSMLEVLKPIPGGLIMAGDADGY